MALSGAFLEVADELARLGSTRPKQAALRRAISTAYYAAFHFLIEEATKHLAGVRATEANLRAFIARGITHSGMKAVCKSVGSGSWPGVVEQRIGKGKLAAPSPLLKNVAAAFVNLQELRHSADYDPLRRFSRADAIIEVGRAKALIHDWDSVPDGDERTFFLYLMVVAAPRRSDD